MKMLLKTSTVDYRVQKRDERVQKAKRERERGGDKAGRDGVRETMMSIDRGEPII